MRITKCFLIIILFIISCKKEINQLPEGDRRIVINGLITNDSLFGLTISRSSNFSDTLDDMDKFMNNTTVLLSQENKILDTLNYNFTGYFNPSVQILVPSTNCSKKIKPILNSDYTVIVKALNFPDAKVNIHIPSIVKIDKIDTTVNRLEGKFEEWESNVRLNCSIEFSDPNYEKNWYMFFVFKRTGNSFIQETEFCEYSCQDPIVEEKINHGTISVGVAFTEKSISGRKYNLKFTINGKSIGSPFFDFYNNGFNNPYHRTAVYFRLYSITEDYFKYIQTLNLFYKNYKNPLAEPTQVYSNIQGGYGILGGAAVSTDSLVFTY